MDESRVVMFVSHLSLNLDRGKNKISPWMVENALDDISFKLHEGEALGIFGETGSGKTLLLDTLLYTQKPTKGDVFLNVSDELRVEIEEINRRVSKIKADLREKYGFNEEEEEIEGNDELDLLEERYEVICRENSLSRMGKKELNKMRGYIQPVFQEIFKALDPAKTIRDSIGDPMKLVLHLSDEELNYKILFHISEVGLKEDILGKYPTELSVSQLQKVNLVRTFSVNPKIIILDDPMAYLDATSRAKVLNLLRKKQNEEKTSLIILSNNLEVLRSFTQNVAVIHRGKIVEHGSTDEIFSNAMHPYTKIMVSSIPNPDPFVIRQKIQLKGQRTYYEHLPTGCSFHTRCPNVMKNCGWSTADLIDSLRDMLEISRLHDPDSLPEIENIGVDEAENIMEISFREGETYDQNLVKSRIEEIIRENSERERVPRFQSIEFIEFDSESNNLIIQIMKPKKPTPIEISGKHTVSCFMYASGENEDEP